MFCFVILEGYLRLRQKSDEELAAPSLGAIDRLKGFDTSF